MKCLLALVALAIVASGVTAETCDEVSECVGTLCASDAEHAHIQCVERHCTCVEDPIPCLLSTECHVGKCIDKAGHDTDWHCVDGNCVCVLI